MEKTSAVLAPRSVSTSRPSCMESKVVISGYMRTAKLILRRCLPSERYTLNICESLFLSMGPTVLSCYSATETRHLNFRGCRWPENSAAILEKLFRTDRCFGLGCRFKRPNAHAGLQAGASWLADRGCEHQTAFRFGLTHNPSCSFEH